MQLWLTSTNVNKQYKLPQNFRQEVEIRATISFASWLAQLDSKLLFMKLGSFITEDTVFPLQWSIG
jgi:hypothetical protein